MGSRSNQLEGQKKKNNTGFENGVLQFQSQTFTYGRTSPTDIFSFYLLLHGLLLGIAIKLLSNLVSVL